MQPMTGLTAGAGATVPGASAPFSSAPDSRIVTTRTRTNTWKIFWRNFATWDNLEQPFAGTGAGSSMLINHDDANWRVVGAGFFFGYGGDAILRRNLSTGEVKITQSTLDNRVWVEPDANWRIVAVEDFDGDGNNDILWRHALTGTCFMILQPGGASAEVFHYEPDLNWQIVAAGDVNADGRADIVWRNSADGRVWIQAMDGYRTIGGNVVWIDANPNWRINGLADLDGNGSKDLVWRNAANGLVFGILMNANLTVLASGVIHNEPNQNWKIVAPNTAEAALNGNH